MVMPGDNVNLRVRLIAPVAIEEGLRFAIREGGLTVGAGVVTKILDKKSQKPISLSEKGGPVLWVSPLRDWACQDVQVRRWQWVESRAT